MSLVTLSDVKAYLNITSMTSDDELSDFLYDAVAAVSDVVGALGPTTVTEEFDTHGPNIVLSRTPVQSVVSISIQPWLGAAPIDDTAAWRLNTKTGVLRRAVVGGALPYYGQGSILTVTYVVGRYDIPRPINRAILMQVKDMWTSQRGSMALPASGGPDAPPMYGGQVGFLGADVMELLRPYLPPPGIA